MNELHDINSPQILTGTRSDRTELLRGLYMSKDNGDLRKKNISNCPPKPLRDWTGEEVKMPTTQMRFSFSCCSLCRHTLKERHLIVKQRGLSLVKFWDLCVQGQAFFSLGLIQGALITRILYYSLRNLRMRFWHFFLLVTSLFKNFLHYLKEKGQYKFSGACLVFCKLNCILLPSCALK